MHGALKVLLVLLGAGALYVARPYVFPEKRLEVDVYRASRGEVRETVTSPSSGTIVSKHEAVVASECVGRIAKVVLDRGDRADEGALVVLIDDGDAQVEVRAAEAALATRRAALESAQFRVTKAEEDFASADPLFEKRLISDDQHRAWRTARDTARADVSSARCAVGEAQVAVERAKVALSKRRVVAPFAGVIRRKLVEAGEYVVVGTPCFEMYDDASVFIRAPIDEVDLPRIRAGLVVDVTLEPFGERVFTGVLRMMEPGVSAAKELNRTGEIEVDLKDLPEPSAGGVWGGVSPPQRGAAQDGSYPASEGPLRVGMSADVEVVVRTRPQALRVPAYAVHETDDGRYVFMVTADRIEKRTVKIGLSNWDYAEIAEGLREGDAVVVSLDMKDLAPGKPAHIAREIKRAEVQ